MEALSDIHYSTITVSSVIVRKSIHIVVDTYVRTSVADKNFGLFNRSSYIIRLYSYLIHRVKDVLFLARLLNRIKIWFTFHLIPSVQDVSPHPREGEPLYS